MQIDAKQLDGKPRRVGTYASRPVMEVRTKGGLHLIVSPRADKGPEVLGTGPHRAVARAVALKHHKIEWNDLTKGDWIDPIHYQFLMPQYEELRTRFRAALGDK